LPKGRAPAHREVHVGRDMDYGGALCAEDAAWLREVFASDQQRLFELTGIRYQG